MSVETAETSAAWHQQQRQRATTYKPSVRSSQIPGSYGCAGDCTLEAPPPPGQEGFLVMSAAAAPPPPTPILWLLLAGATLLFGVAFGSKRRARWL